MHCSSYIESVSVLEYSKEQQVTNYTHKLHGCYIICLHVQLDSHICHIHIREYVSTPYIGMTWVAN